MTEKKYLKITLVLAPLLILCLWKFEKLSGMALLQFVITLLLVGFIAAFFHVRSDR